MAEAFARQYGGYRVEAYSAGSRPSGRVHPKAVGAMRERGCDLGWHRSKGLAEIPNVEFDAVISMGCGRVDGRVHARKYEDWDVPAPKDLPPEKFRMVRDQIEEQVERLLAGLGALPRL
jgi:protein-tyrosine-phosphatase